MPAKSPSKRRPPIRAEALEKVVALLELGADFEVSLEVAGIGIDAFDARLEREPKLRSRIATARAVGETRNVAAITVAAATDWRAAAWLLERSAPERWARPALRSRPKPKPAEVEADAAGAAPPPPEPADAFSEVDELAARRLQH